jgi:hypothetical protein
MQTNIYKSSSQFNLSFNHNFLIRKKRLFILLAAMFMVAFNQAYAEDVVPDKFKIALGGYAVLRYNTLLSLTEPNLGVGVAINPDASLGLSAEQSVLRLEGYYRFNNKHALTYSWYSIGSEGNKSLEEEIDWIDENGNPITIPIGARVGTILNYDIYKVGYLWSFLHTDKVELGVGAGLHATRIEVELNAEYTGSEVSTADVSTTVPLPVVSFGVGYNVTPKFSWHIKTELFALKFDDWDGVYTDSSLGMEYRVFKHVGLGIGLASNSLRVTEDANDYRFYYDNRITGVMLDVAAYF